jgi:tyrosyl-tRNA synthetase
MAGLLTARLHGEDAARAAEEHFDRLHVAREMPDEIEDLEIAPADGSVHLPAVIKDGFGLSSSEARRLLTQGGVKLDGEALGAEDLDVPADRLDGRVLQVGKRRFRRLRIG